MVAKSNSAAWEKAHVPVVRRLVFNNVAANFTFTLPGSAVLTGDLIFMNNSANTQALITVGSAAAGTQFGTSAALNTLTDQVVASTRVQPLRADRLVYVESAAWQGAGVHVAITYTELPPIRSIQKL